MTSMDQINEGDIYGIQKVIKKNVYDPNSKAKQKVRMCLCKCTICGKESYKQPCNLLNGKTISCRCRVDALTAKRNKKNSSVKVGNIYGNIQVLEDLGFREQSRGKKESWYRCKCLLCGREDYEVNGTNVKYVKSCGCISSQGEQKIAQILEQNNINFCKEYKFTDLYWKDKTKPLRFDFAIFENNQLKCLIEFDGRQHETGPEGIWTKRYSLEDTQYRDKLKNEYCKRNHLKLIRIPYTDLNKIDLQYLKNLGI